MGERAHGGGEVLARHRIRHLPLHGLDGGGEMLLSGLLQELASTGL